MMNNNELEKIKIINDNKIKYNSSNMLYKTF